MFDINIHIIYYIRTDPVNSTSAIANPRFYGFVDIHEISRGSSNSRPTLQRSIFQSGQSGWYIGTWFFNYF